MSTLVGGSFEEMLGKQLRRDENESYYDPGMEVKNVVTVILLYNRCVG